MAYFPVGVLLALLASPPPAFTGSPSLSILVTDLGGLPVQGANLQLCPLDETFLQGTNLRLSRSEACFERGTDDRGHAVFDELPEAEYSLVVSLEGYADTAVFPLPVGRLSPVAPDEIKVLLNPVCFDCVGPGSS